jgi:threonine dehydrogenase-like Zn-dependent dehydrogenase
VRALVLRAPGVAEMDDIAEPEMQAGEALLRVRRVGLCGSDLNTYRGRNPMVSYPRIPGHEIAATIVALSEKHPRLKVEMDVTLSPYSSCGDCTACRNGRPNACRGNQTLGVQRDGALTEYITVPVEKLYTAELNLQELCMVEPLTVGFHAVARGRVTAKDTVAVVGCGGVGLGAVAASAFRGARTIAVDIDDDKLAIARAAGAAETVHSRRHAMTEALAEMTGGAGPDVVIEAIGMPETFRAAVQAVAFTGRVVYIGYAKEPVSYETKLFVQKEIDILGTRNALPGDFSEVIAMLEQKRFPVEQAVNLTVPLEEAPEALRSWSEEPGRFRKIMIDLDQRGTARKPDLAA